MSPAPHSRGKARVRVAAFAFLLCLATLLPTRALGEATPITSYADEGCNHANVVLLIRFAGDTAGDNGDGFNAPASDARKANGIYTDWGYLERELNAPDESGYVKYSMVDYITYVSGGQMKLYNYLPQTMSDQTVRYITLDDTFDSYRGYNGNTDDARIMREALAKFNAEFSFDGRLADKNGDGYADCVTFYLQLPPGCDSSSFRSHQSTAGNAAAGYLTIGSTNPVGIDEYVAISNKSTGMGPGVFSHEFLHSLGAADYYREGATTEAGGAGSSNQPVGIWDIMASSEGWSGITALTRQDCGWGDIKFGDLPSSGQTKTYTLTSWPLAANDPNARQAIAFRSPLNDSEYFVVEYRKQGAKSTGDWDPYITGTGLIVYRVNPALVEEGNFKGNDYVYVFRRGETGLHDSYSSNQVFVPAHLNAAEYPTFGSTDLTATITSDGGALVYSNGQNSGIKITVTEDGANSATFQIETADYAALDLWDDATGTNGTLPATTGSVLALAGDDSSLYMLACTGESTSQPTVSRWDGTTWTALPLAPAGLLQPSIAVAGGKVYVAGVDSSGRLGVYSSTGGAWSKVATVGSGLNEGSVFSVNGSIYAAVSSDSKATAYVLSGSTFSQVGATVSGSYLTKPTVFSLGSGVGLAVSDFFGSGTNVYALSGSSSNRVASTSFKAGSISSTKVGDTTYVLLGENGGAAPHLLSFSASGAFLGEKTLDALAGYGNPGNIASMGDNLLFVGDVNSTVKVMSASVDNLDAWTQVGSDVLSPADSGLLGVLGNKIYVATSSSSTPYLKWHSFGAAPEPEPTYSLTYSWTGAPAGQSLPQGSDGYATADAAKAAVSATPAANATVRGEQGGKVGTFTFSGWAVSDPNADRVLTATGSWSFKADEWRVSYSWTGVPSGQKLPSNNNVYNTEAEARKAVSPTPAKGAKVSGVKDGKVGTFTFSGWTAKASGNTVKASGSWTFVPTPNKWTRVWGQDHYDTAAAVCRADKVFSSTGGTVVLATGESYWDALSASGLAGLYRAPILITPGSSLGSQARAELQRLRPSRVVVMGGWMAVSDSTLAAVRQAVPGAKVERCYGQAQDDTARAAFQAAPRSSWGDTCVVATSNGYWDALSIAPYAYSRHAPIFLTRGGAGAQNVLSPATMSAIRSAGFKRVVIVGGTMAVPASVESSLRSAGLTVTRLWGQDHYDTSAKIAEWELSQGMTTAHMAVSTGRGYWDALSGAALVGAQGSVVAIADDGHLQAIDAAGARVAGNVQGGYVLGGEMAVSRKTWDYLQ